MCTVILEVPSEQGRHTRVLAVRDEMPDRPWDPPGLWWPELPRVRGVRDRRAGGAWLATRDGTLSVILNRPESVASTLADGAAPLESRGRIVLDSVQGLPVPDEPHTESFNLVEVHGPRVTVTEWDGERVRRQELPPGIHMIAHGAVNDMEFARIAAWLPPFRLLAGLPDDGWRNSWLGALALSTEFGPDDDRAIIRDNTVHGYPTQSLLVCLADVGSTRVNLSTLTFAEPAHWDGEELVEIA